MWSDVVWCGEVWFGVMWYGVCVERGVEWLVCSTPDWCTARYNGVPHTILVCIARYSAHWTGVQSNGVQGGWGWSGVRVGQVPGG